LGFQHVGAGKALNALSVTMGRQALGFCMLLYHLDFDLVVARGTDRAGAQGCMRSELDL
jgi:hypothetical protein